MKRLFIALPVLLATLLLALPVFTQTETPETKVFDITVEKYKFEPSKITVNKGDKVVLNFKSKDVTHGVELSDFGKKRELIEKDKIVTIEFVADKVGLFEYRCKKWCGFGHIFGFEKLKIEIKEKTA
jgi:heme/copper-type cytochrome/quinol oxidase subunit 2